MQPGSVVYWRTTEGLTPATALRPLPRVRISAAIPQAVLNEQFFIYSGTLLQDTRSELIFVVISILAFLLRHESPGPLNCAQVKFNCIWVFLFCPLFCYPLFLICFVLFPLNFLCIQAPLHRVPPSSRPGSLFSVKRLEPSERPW